MPIYEYQAVDLHKACRYCRLPFETFQGIGENPLTGCPNCGKGVKRLISRCHAAVTEASESQVRVERKIREYESSGMWSHAAELADTHSEKTKDRALKTRALDNYKKAGYDTGALDRHANTNSD